MKQVRYFEDVKIILKELEETKKDVKDMSIDELKKELEIRKSLYIYKSPIWGYFSEEDGERNKCCWDNEYRIEDIKKQLKK
jgi:S-adenosylmethionine synthetase